LHSRHFFLIFAAISSSVAIELLRYMDYVSFCLLVFSFQAHFLALTPNKWGLKT
jgi:hypothetical protein